ncbi:MAG: EamA family transporter [Lachnospiraceae bacterium]|nr:EamA family transporter [Lachnospiraceae bacterium]
MAYTLQVVGQKGADPAIASLIMSLESVISAISGFVFLHQRLSSREVLGCVLMFSAIILVQLPVKRKAAEPQHQ